MKNVSITKITGCADAPHVFFDVDGVELELSTGYTGKAVVRKAGRPLFSLRFEKTRDLESSTAYGLKVANILIAVARAHGICPGYYGKLHSQHN